MLSLWLTAALAAPPPPGVDIDDPARYDAWSKVLDGPPGCWEVVGHAAWSWDFGKTSWSKGSAVFIGRLEDGVWQDFLIRSLGEDLKQDRNVAVRVYAHDETRFLPLVGRFTSVTFDDDQDGVGDSLLGAVFARVGVDVDYAWTSWDDARDGVVLHRAIPFGDGANAPEAAMEVFFPAGQALPTQADVDFPKVFSPPGMRLTKVRDAEAHVRSTVAGGMVFPQAETFSFQAGALGFKATGAQSIRYQTFRPCGGATTTTQAPIAAQTSAVPVQTSTSGAPAKE